MVKNSAFVFIKPHAVTDKVKELVKETFDARGITIKKEGAKEAEEIDKNQLVDKHYYSIASKATLLTPDKLNIPKEKFKEKFGVDWEEALKDGKCLNAKDACEKFACDADALDKLWAACKKAGDLAKFGGGFYCGKLTHDGQAYYVFNGFFMTMRSKFVEAGTSIYYYVVEWDSEACTWADFRGKVLGPTDPAAAPKDSLRGAIAANWKDLGLKFEPNVGDNAVHASASPFEALAERMNWLDYRVDRDPFGKPLLKTGVTKKQVMDWSTDPQVTFGPAPITKSLFDSVEDTDSDYCLALLQMIGGHCQPKSQVETLEKEVERLKALLEAYKPLEKAVLAIQAHVAPPPAKVDEREPTKGAGKGKGKGKAASEQVLKGKAEGKGKGKGKSDPEPVEEKPPLRRRKGDRGKGGGGGGKGKGTR